MTQTKQTISDEAVKAKTGKTWPQWYRVLDAAGARAMDHKGIVAEIAKTHPDLDGWWVQMVTVGYEQARGLRQKHQKPDGFQIGASKTVQVPLGTLYAAFHDTRRRGRWLALPARTANADIEIRKATTDRSMRVTWADGRTRLDVNFYAKGDAKSQVALQHGKLKDAREAERMKAFWSKQLAALKDYLEG